MVQSTTNETQSSVFERSRGIEIKRTKLPMTHIIENVKKTNGERERFLPHGSRFSRGTSLNTRHGASFLILMFELREIFSTIPRRLSPHHLTHTRTTIKNKSSRCLITLNETFGVVLRKAMITRERVVVSPCRSTIVNLLIDVIQTM